VTAAQGNAAAIGWRVFPSPDELIEYAHDCCVFRELTPEECEQVRLPPAEGF
jgi:hypothetical protein